MKTLFLNNTKKLSLMLVLVFSILGLSACSSPEEKAQTYYENGMELLENNELGKATIQFRNALQLDKTMTKAIWGLVLVSEKQRKPQQTFNLLNSLLANDPEHVAGLVKIGRLYLVAGAVDKALEKSDAALAIAPDDLSVLAFRASVLFKLDDSEGAVKIAKQVIAKDPGYVDALIVLAIERLAAKDAQKAIEYLDQGLEKNQKNVVLQLIKVQALDSLAKLDLAEDVFKRLISFYPDISAFNYALAQFYFKHDRKDDAEAEFRKVVVNKPDDLNAKVKLIQLLNYLKGKDAAQSQLIDFVNQQPDNYDLKFALIQFYIGNKQLGDANKVIASIISTATDTETIVKAMGVKAGLLLAKGDKPAAENVAKAILEKDPTNETALVIKSSINIDRQQFEQAISDLRVVLRDAPNSSRALFYLARAHLLSGSPELADEQFFKAFKTSRYNAGYGLSYAQFLLKRNQPKRAEKVLLNVLSASPKNAQVLRTLAQIRLNLGDWIGAQQIADKIKQLGDKNDTVAQIQSAILVGKKDYDQSISLLKKTYQATPDNIQPVVALVRTYLIAGKPDEAGNFLDAVINASPKNINARILRGQVYVSLGQFDKAINSYEQAINIAPDNVAAHYNLAATYIRTKQFDKADRALDDGLKIVPDNFLLRLTRAGILEQQGKIDEAISLYESLLKDRPNADIVANNLSSLLTDYRNDKESHDRAYALSQRFKRTEIPQFKDTFGWASYRVGKYSDANALLEDAAEKLPQLPVVQYHLGMNYLAKDNKQQARDALEKALELAGDRPFEQADEIRAALEKL